MDLPFVHEALPPPFHFVFGQVFERDLFLDVEVG